MAKTPTTPYEPIPADAFEQCYTGSTKVYVDCPTLPTLTIAFSLVSWYW